MHCHALIRNIYGKVSYGFTCESLVSLTALHWLHLMSLFLVSQHSLASYEKYPHKKHLKMSCELLANKGPHLLVVWIHSLLSLLSLLSLCSAAWSWLVVAPGLAAPDQAESPHMHSFHGRRTIN